MYESVFEMYTENIVLVFRRDSSGEARGGAAARLAPGWLLEDVCLKSVLRGE